MTSSYSARILHLRYRILCRILNTMKNTVFFCVFCAVPRGILAWYSEGLRILCELLENTGILLVFWGILSLSQNMALTLFHMLVFLCILVYSCAFLMYSVEYGQFWEMCRIRVEYG